jgi:hypothetical protein
MKAAAAILAGGSPQDHTGANDTWIGRAVDKVTGKG